MVNVSVLLLIVTNTKDAFLIGNAEYVYCYGW